MSYIEEVKKLKITDFFKKFKYFGIMQMISQTVKISESENMKDLIIFCTHNSCMTNQFILSYIFKNITMLQLVFKGHECFNIFSFSGYKLVMEDEYIIHTDFYNKLQICAIFDGHSGNQCVTYLKNNYLTKLYKNKNFIDFLTTNNKFQMISALNEITLEFDKYFISVNIKGGSTAILTIITSDNIYTSNVGDSRAIIIKKYLGNNTFDFFATSDQKPYVYEERIKNAGGFIENNRVDGFLALGNAFGDVHFKKNKCLPISKQKVVAESDIEVTPNTFDIIGIILGCDGIYDVYTNEELINDCVMFTKYCATNLAEAILNMALLKDSHDNLTICTSIKKNKFILEETVLLTNETFNFLKLISVFIEKTKKLTKSQLLKEQLKQKNKLK